MYAEPKRIATEVFATLPDEFRKPQASSEWHSQQPAGMPGHSLLEGPSFDKHGNLWCVGDGGDKPRVLWKMPLGAPVASVLLADVDGDGKCEIIASVGDGTVYVLGPANAKDAR